MKTSVDEPEKKIYRTNSGLRIFGRVIRSRPSDVDIYIYIYTRPASPIIIALLELLACGTPVLRFHIPALINIPSLHLSFFSEPIHMPMQLSITTLRSVARKVISFLCTHGKGDLRCRACGINKQQARHHVRGHLQKMHGRDSCMIWDKAQRQGVASRTGQNIIPARAD